MVDEERKWWSSDDGLRTDGGLASELELSQPELIEDFITDAHRWLKELDEARTENIRLRLMLAAVVNWAEMERLRWDFLPGDHQDVQALWKQRSEDLQKLLRGDAAVPTTDGRSS